MMPSKDAEILRELARRVAEVAAEPVQEKRRNLWKSHNSLKQKHPMLLAFPQGSWRELIPETALKCQEKESRQIEMQLRSTLYEAEHFAHDKVVESEWIVDKHIIHGGFGIQPKMHESPDSTGAWGFDPVIQTAADLGKFRMPEISYDEKATMEKVSRMKELFGGILNVRLKGASYIQFKLMNIYSRFRGLEQVLLDMYDEPAMLHEAMSLLERAHHEIIRQYRELNLLSLNNDATFQSSGGNGYTEELPKAGFDPEHVRTADMWGAAEAQELAQVSPDMHSEFILPYEKRLLAHFGLNGYGCCEDLTRKLDDVLSIPNIRRISISPWADVEACAMKLKDKAIFSWKPNPAMLCGGFRADAVRKYVRKTIRATSENGCVLEIILKDTHTCENHPERLDMWIQIAREEIDKMGETHQ